MYHGELHDGDASQLPNGRIIPWLLHPRCAAGDAMQSALTQWRLGQGHRYGKPEGQHLCSHDDDVCFWDAEKDVKGWWEANRCPCVVRSVATSQPTSCVCYLP
ncbi:hypothetical protein H0G86_004346 [Trichoderma simmonsii]|uniref:Uncharacterized protein n=1 Tax=Trichoderma simmonsii TaxID=1491479 RepID=A0A8G0PBY9_9HYPO|nr:hypothetical protein H0G86_004346 [Trichoderma simmonsii]